MKVTCEIAECREDLNVIDVRFPYSRTFVEAMRDVAGRSFQGGSDKHWHVPLDMEACRSLRRAFGDALIIGPRLKSWATAQVRMADRLGALSLAVEAAPMQRLHRVLPALHRAVWIGPKGRYMTEDEKDEAMKGPGSYQAADVQFIAEAPAPFVGNDQGTGKTLTWIASVWEAGIEEGCHLIIAPKAAVSGTWEGELRRWQAERDDVEVFVCVDERGDREAVLDAFERSTARVKWVVVNPHMLMWRKDPSRTSKRCISVGTGKKSIGACVCGRLKGPHEHYVSPYPQLDGITWRTLCIDEAHKGSVRNHKSLTAKSLKAIKVMPAPHGKRAAMSGTPIRKKGGSDVWGLLNYLRPDVFTSSWRFWGTYFEIHEDDYGKKVGDLRPEMTDELFRALQPYMLRRLKSEVAPWLPDKMYIPVDCFMGKKQLAQYASMETEGVSYANANDSERVVTTGTLDRLTRLKQFANAYCEVRSDGTLEPIESCKVDALIEKMDEAGMFDEGSERKQLIFSQSREMVRYTARRLREQGLDVEIISGKDNAKSAQRNDLIDRFQNGDLRCLVIVTTAGGVSLTLDAADEVHLLDEMWDPGDDAQAEDRAHRVSRIHQVTIYIYRSIGTIDQDVADAKEAKAASHSLVLDVRRRMVARRLGIAA